MIHKLVTMAMLFLAVTTVMAAPPSVESADPVCAQVGQNFTLTITGSRLSKPADILFYRPGVRLSKFTTVDDSTLKVELVSSPDAPLGAHPFRLRTEMGASEILQFHLALNPVIYQKTGNSSAAKAQPVTCPCAVTGNLGEGEVHWYAVTLAKGQSLVVEAEGMRTGTAFLDTHLEIRDPSGKLVTQADDSPLTRQDALVEFKALSDGKHTIALRDSNLGGSENASYILHIGSFFRPIFMHPAGGKPGLTLKTNAYDSTGARPVELKLPAGAQGTIPVWLAGPDGQSPCPNLVRVTNHEPVLETQSTPPAALPAAFHGIVAKPDEVDSYRFTTRPGKPVAVQMWAWRLGSPLDSVVELIAEDGTVVATGDDGDDHDSQLVFTPRTAGPFTLRVRDQRGQGGPGFFYRVEIGEDQPHLEVFLPRPNRLSQTRQVIVVPKGGRVLAGFGVRRSGLEGYAQTEASGLPAGVSMSSQPARPGIFIMPALFEARADTALAGALCPLKVTDNSYPGLSGSFRQVVDLVAGPADSIYQAVELDKLAVTVVPELPFSVDLVAPKAPLLVDGQLFLKVMINRKTGFDGPVEVTAPFLPPWVEAPEKVLAGKGQNEVNLVLTALPDAEPANWQFAVQGSAELDATGTARCASRFVPLTITKPLLQSSRQEVIAEQGGIARFRFDLTGDPERSALVPAGVSCRLLELPPRVADLPVTVQTVGKRVDFSLPVQADGPVGTHGNIVCALEMDLAGDKFVQFVGRDSSLRIDSKGSTSIGPDGRPLSRLEQLRVKKAKSASPKP